MLSTGSTMCFYYCSYQCAEHSSSNARLARGLLKISRLSSYLPGFGLHESTTRLRSTINDWQFIYRRGGNMKKARCWVLFIYRFLVIVLREVETSRSTEDHPGSPLGTLMDYVWMQNYVVMFRLASQLDCSYCYQLKLVQD